MAVYGNNGIESIGENAPTGMTFGLPTGKISFYGVTPAAQISVGTLATTAPTSSSPFGFTEAQATAILAGVQALKTIGLVA